MKRLIIFCAIVFGGGFSMNATNINPVTENFNHGNECISRANCWKFWCVDVKSYSNYLVNSGSEKPGAVTSRLCGIQWCGRAYYSTAKLYSPWTNFNGTGKVTFKHKLSDNSGRYNKLRAYLIDDQGNVVQKIFDYVYNHNYSSPNGNPTHAQTASIDVTWSGVYRIKWYWLGYGGCSRGVVDDVVIDGDYSSNPCRWCKPIVPTCTDTDGDGCCDDVDDFPNDPTKCNGIYIPNVDDYNTVAYEDLWPAAGDYDFNDKVINRYTVYGLNAQNQVVDIEHKFVLRAAGAGFHNGFGIRMNNVPAAAVASVTGTVMASNPANSFATIESNGVEAGQTDAVIIVWEDWKDVRTITKNGTFYNTLPGTGGEGYGDTVTIKIVFATPQNTTDMDWDPFLVRNGARGSEIHLPWKGPTDLADLTKFNTSSDASALNAFGNNYVDINNKPWAIYTPNSSFDYPVEYVDIVTAHLKFAAWSSSNGVLFPDWYEDQPGYRDATKIY